MKNKTSGITLLEHVWGNNNTKSWGALNTAMRDAMKLAIGSQMGFSTQDIVLICNTMSPWRWMGEGGWEYYYAYAVTVGNMSFVKAFEESFFRKPFFANGVRTIHPDGYVNRHEPWRQRERLAVGFRIDEEGRKITSIHADYVVLSIYEGEGRKPTSVKKLTHADLLALYPAPKKGKKVAS